MWDSSLPWLDELPKGQDLGLPSDIPPSSDSQSIVHWSAASLYPRDLEQQTFHPVKSTGSEFWGSGPAICSHKLSGGLDAPQSWEALPMYHTPFYGCSYSGASLITPRLCWPGSGVGRNVLEVKGILVRTSRKQLSVLYPELGHE